MASTDDNGFNSSSFVKRDPETAALMSKLVESPYRQVKRDEKGNRQFANAQQYSFRRDSAERAKKNHDAKLQMKMLPDLKLSAQILVSSIMAPGDMVSTEVTIESSSDAVTTELTRSLIEPIKEYFEQEYDLKKKAPEHLEKALIIEGASPILILPENIIDSYINGQVPITMESMSKFIQEDGVPKPIGILGRAEAHVERKKVRGFAVENFKETAGVDRIDQRLLFDNDKRESDVVISDNLVALKIPMFNKKLRENATKRVYAKTYNGFGFENYKPKTVSDFHLESAIRPNRTHKHEQTSEIPKPNIVQRKSVGKPLIMDLPTESVIPVHVPGDPKAHIAYFIVLDEEGNPIKALEKDFLYQPTQSNLNSQAVNSLGSNIIQRVNTNMGAAGSFDFRNKTHMDMASQIYAEVLERDLIARIKNGTHNRMVEVANNQEIMRVMLSRTFQRKFTQLLFVPLDYIVYIAFDYNDNGMGQSLLDEGSIINTMRSTLTFADLLANIKNSIGRTSINLEIDPEDPDPEKTFAQAKDWVAKSRRLEPPTTISTPAEITDFLNEACVSWSVSGDHEGVPKLKVEVEQKNTSYPRVDSELRDELKKHSIQLMGLTPEQVDNGLAGEFATTVVANSILLSKRVVVYQDAFCPQLADLVRKIVRFTPVLLDKLFDTLKENFEQIKYKLDDYEQYTLQSCNEEEKKKHVIYCALHEFISSVRVSLPKPPSITLENQMTGLNTYMEALGTAIDQAFMNEEALVQEVIGDASANLPYLKAHVKSLYLRRYMLSKGILPELQELVAVDDDGKPQISVLDESIRHTENLVKSLVRSSAKTAPLAAAATQDLQRITEGQQAEGSGSVDTSTDDSSGDSGGDDGMGNVDDLGGDFGDDLSGDDASDGGDE